MLSKEYCEAAVDVLDILNHMEWNDFSKVSTKFIEFLEENASSDYEAKLDYSKEIADMDLSQETIGILSVMYRQFWCQEEKKPEFDKKLHENEIKFQEELRMKYDPDKLFKKSDIDVNSIENSEKKELIVSEREESVFEKMINKIKSFFSSLFMKN